MTSRLQHDCVTAVILRLTSSASRLLVHTCISVFRSSGTPAFAESDRHMLGAFRWRGDVHNHIRGIRLRQSFGGRVRGRASLSEYRSRSVVPWPCESLRA